MAEALQTARFRDFYAPTFDLTIGGSAIEASLRADITEIVVRDTLNGLDSFELSINNWEASGQSVKYVDARLFDPPAAIDVKLGYYGREELVVRAETTTVDIRFSGSGENLLKVRGVSLLHRLRREQRTHVYERKTATQIARAVADRLGVTLRTNASASASEEAYDYVLQDNAYDVVFLLERARRVGYDLVVEPVSGGNDRLYFGPACRLPAMESSLRLGRSLLDFEVIATAVNQCADVVVRGWDYRAKRAIEVRSGRGDAAAAGSNDLAGAIDRSVAERHETITDRFVATSGEARVLARAAMDSVARGAVVARGTAIGLPGLRAGVTVEIEGVGRRYSGRYLVTETTHRLGTEGYRTGFAARREART